MLNYNSVIKNEIKQESISVKEISPVIKINLNEWLVLNGHAVAYRKYSKKYISNEINAKNEKKGVWQGKFEMPWDYRRKK